MDCGGLSVTPPDQITIPEEPRPTLLNPDSVGEIVRSSYSTPFIRQASIQALVQADGRISHACVLMTSGDSRYNQAVCIGIGPQFPVLDPSPDLRGFLRETELPVHPATSCDVDFDHRFKSRQHARLILTDTDVPAMALWVDIPDRIERDRLVIMAGYYEGTLSAADYDCTVERKGGEWSVIGCDLTSIS
jgi:hypothetical protein